VRQRSRGENAITQLAVVASGKDAATASKESVERGKFARACATQRGLQSMPTPRGALSPRLRTALHGALDALADADVEIVVSRDKVEIR
jgi:hypothetical protein